MCVDLSSWTTIRVSGKESIEYLDGLLPNNLPSLTTAISFFLNHKAKIQVIFWIERQDNQLLFYIPPKMRDTAISLLLKYKLSMEVKLEDISEEMPNLYLKPSDNFIHGLGNYKFTHSKDKPECLSYAIFSEDRDFLDPSVYINQNPFEMGLADSVYLPKGCFLGQEPLSRMYNMGKPRSFLYKLTTGRRIKQIYLNQQVVGEVLQEKEDVIFAAIKSSVQDLSQLIEENYLENIVKMGSYPDFKRT